MADFGVLPLGDGRGWEGGPSGNPEALRVLGEGVKSCLLSKSFPDPIKCCSMSVLAPASPGSAWCRSLRGRDGARRGNSTWSQLRKLWEVGKGGERTNKGGGSRYKADPEPQPALLFTSCHISPRPSRSRCHPRLGKEP